MDDVDKAWIALGIIQAKLLLRFDSATKKELAQAAMDELGDQAEMLYGLTLKSLYTLANTSLEHLVRIGLVTKARNRFSVINEDVCGDTHRLSKLLHESLSQGI